MNRSLWAIAVLGAVTLGLMMIMMWYGLDTMTSGPAGNRIRLARKLHEKFGMKSVGVFVRDEGGKPLMRITYRTERSTGRSGPRQLEEIAQVAAFAGEHYEGKDREKIEKIHVVRTEVFSRGCWTGTDPMEATHPNPAYRDPDAPEEFRFNGTNPR